MRGTLAILGLLALLALVVGDLVKTDAQLRETRALTAEVHALATEVRQMARERRMPELGPDDMYTSWPCSTAPNGRCEVLVTRASGQSVEAWIAAFDARVAQKRIEFPPGT